MDGVNAVRAVLTADAAMIALVPAVRIAAGPLAIDAPLPSVSLQSVSKTDLNIPAPGATRFVRERVQVTVFAENYPSQKAILRAVRHAAADKLFPAVAGISGVTIHTESAGPDFVSEDTTIWISVQDFIVRYTETR